LDLSLWNLKNPSQKVGAVSFEKSFKILQEGLMNSIVFNAFDISINRAQA
jgi:hypothetical protein